MSADILVYSGKYDHQYWLVDTPQRLEGAQRALFQQLDENGFYGYDQRYIREARNGDIRAIRYILEERRSCEYEYWDIEKAEITE